MDTVWWTYLEITWLQNESLILPSNKKEGQKDLTIWDLFFYFDESVSDFEHDVLKQRYRVVIIINSGKKYIFVIIYSSPVIQTPDGFLCS